MPVNTTGCGVTQPGGVALAAPLVLPRLRDNDRVARRVRIEPLMGKAEGSAASADEYLIGARRVGMHRSYARNRPVDPSVWVCSTRALLS